MILVTEVVNAEVELNVIVPEVDVKFTVAVEVVTKLLFESSAWIVTAPEATPAVIDWAALVITTLLAAAAVTVSV